MAELKRLVNQAMEELLNLARQLRPTALDDHGLVPAIDAQLKRFAERTGTEVELDAEGEFESLGEDEQTAVYRIVQEALTNVGRHAGAKLGRDPARPRRLRHGAADPRRRDRLRPELLPGGGLGLEGMAERARVVGGELDLRSVARGAGHR